MFFLCPRRSASDRNEITNSQRDRSTMMGKQSERKRIFRIVSLRPVNMSMSSPVGLISRNGKYSFVQRKSRRRRRRRRQHRLLFSSLDISWLIWSCRRVCSLAQHLSATVQRCIIWLISMKWTWRRRIYSLSFSRDKKQHACGKTIGLIIALVSYILALTLIVGDLFFDSQGKSSSIDRLVCLIGWEYRSIFDLVFGHFLDHFHARTHPLVPPKKWIVPLWMTVYGSQVGEAVRLRFISINRSFRSLG